MASVFDVAKYILIRIGTTDAMKLQKLVYYSQAWHLVWDSAPLFPEKIEAWANGPVVRELYAEHRGQFLVSEGSLAGNPDALSDSQKDSIKRVLAHYSGRPSHMLSAQTHAEAPWKTAREGLEPGERSRREIPIDTLAEYYASLI